MVHGQNYIGGKFHSSNAPLNPQKTFVSTNPSNGEVIGEFPNTSPNLVNQAVVIAKTAQKEWRKLSRVARSEYFDRLAQVLKQKKDVIIKAISLETGKNLNESTAEFNEALHMTQYTFGQGRESFGRIVASEIADKDVAIFRKPKGVVAVIAPFNFPFAIGGFWTSAPAILEGNTVVFKPSEDTPYVGHLIAEAYHEAGFPPGVFNTIHGDGSVGDTLVKGDVDHICFTGSAAVGQSIRKHCAGTWHKSCSCEMGSKSAVIVFDDAPLETAVRASIASAFKLSGQRCVSAGRLLVHRNVYDKFVERFVEETKKLVVGDPFTTPDAFFGPLINESQMKRVIDCNNATANKEGVEVLLNGQRLGSGRDAGWYLSPHVYTCEWDVQYKNNPEDYPFLKQEVFGPHVAIIPFNDAEDAVRIYNDTEYGLSMAVLTTNMVTARYMRDNCDYGLGYHNLPCIGAESHLPFTGVKKSGSGGGSAAATFQNVTHEVTWTANFNPDGFQFCQGLK